MGSYISDSELSDSDDGLSDSDDGLFIENVLLKKENQTLKYQLYFFRTFTIIGIAVMFLNTRNPPDLNVIYI